MSTGSVTLGVRPLDDLRMYDGNTKIHTTEQIAGIAGLIRKVGFRDPIGIKPDGEIVEGHGRYLAAKSLNMISVPVLIIDGLTEAQYRSYRISHNKIAMAARSNAAKVAEIVVSLVQDNGFDPGWLGMSDAKYSKMWRQAAGEETTKRDLSTGPRGGSYEITFSNEAQRRGWLQFNRRLTMRSDADATQGRRLIDFIEHCGILGG